MMTTSSEKVATMLNEMVSDLKRMPNVGVEALAKMFKGLACNFVAALLRATAGALPETTRDEMMGILAAVGASGREGNSSSTSDQLDADDDDLLWGRTSKCHDSDIVLDDEESSGGSGGSDSDSDSDSGGSISKCDSSDCSSSSSSDTETAIEDDGSDKTDACSDAGQSSASNCGEDKIAGKDPAHRALPADFDLAPGAQPGSRLRLYDGTEYTVKAEDKLLLGKCCNLFARVPPEFQPLVRQVVIDLVCANIATVDPGERHKVAEQLQVDQEAAGADPEPDPPKYSRSALRRFDPETSDYTLLFAHVQSGKTAEQMRLAIVAWFVLGVQPIMHVQSSCGRLVHAPQFKVAFEAFADLGAMPGFSVGLADLVRSYENPDRRRWLGLQAAGEDDSTYTAKLNAFLAKFLTIAAVTKPGCATLQSIRPDRLTLPILLANTSSAASMAIKEEKTEKTEKKAARTFLQRMRDVARRAGYKGERVPIMMIFDEDDKQVGSGLYGSKDSYLHLSTKYEIMSNGMAFSLCDLSASSPSDGATAVFRKLVRSTVSVTATPAATLMGKAPYAILRQDKVPWNYFGLANNGFVPGEDPAPERALRIREMTPGKPWLEGPSVSMLPKHIYRDMVLNVAQDMVCEPDAVTPGYRHCLFFGSRIGVIQNALVQTLSIVSSWLSKDESLSRQSAAVFGIEFHSSTYNKGLESFVDDMNAAPLRVYVNKAFFDQHGDSIASGAYAIAARRGLVVRMFGIPDNSIRDFAASVGQSQQGCADGVPDFASLHVIELSKGASAPELRFGFDIVSIIRDKAAARSSFAIGFTGATKAMDGRGVVNKDSQHRSALTDQLLPVGRPDMSSLLQSLRISGCNTEESRRPPQLWVDPGQEKVLETAMQVMNELMNVKADPHFRGMSLPDIVGALGEPELDNKRTEYPNLAALEPGQAVSPSRRARRMMQDIPDQSWDFLRALLRGLKKDARDLVLATVETDNTLLQGKDRASLQAAKDKIVEVLKEDPNPNHDKARAEVLRRFKRKRDLSDQGQQSPASRPRR